MRDEPPRATVLRQFAESGEVYAKYYNQAFCGDGVLWLLAARRMLVPELIQVLDKKITKPKTHA